MASKFSRDSSDTSVERVSEEEQKKMVKAKLMRKIREYIRQLICDQ